MKIHFNETEHENGICLLLVANKVCGVASTADNVQKTQSKSYIKWFSFIKIE